MKRINKSSKLPDAINQSLTKNFTQVPNELLRNPELSFRAKGILCLLLSNREGWYSCIKTITRMSKEGIEAIRSGIVELEKTGYLLRVQYREKNTKIRRGSFWAYTDIPGNFNIEDSLPLLEAEGLEAFIKKPYTEKPYTGKPSLIILYNKNTNNKNTNNKNIHSQNFDGKDINKKIIPFQFENFWKLWPSSKRVDKGKAKTKWEQLCNPKNNKRPTWRQIKSALIKQKKAERWQDPTYIPHPTTWLNQQRWLDDPEQMKSFHKTEKKSFKTPEQIFASELSSGITERLITIVYLPIQEQFNLTTEEEKDTITQNILSLYQWYAKSQKKTKSHIWEEIIPTPSYLLYKYVGWLINGQTWVTSHSPKLFLPANKVFQIFLKEEQERVGFDFLTGKEL